MFSQLLEQWYTPDIQLSVRQVEAIAGAIYTRQPNCRLLVFGCGNDSPLWVALNKNGRTVFLEHSAEWCDRVRAKVPDIEIHHYALPQMTVQSSMRLENVPQIPPPAIMLEESWDVILMIDAPPGHAPERTSGRALSILWTAQCRSEKTHVFLDDVQRPLENLYGKKYLDIHCEIPRGENTETRMGWSIGLSRGREKSSHPWPLNSHKSYPCKKITALCFGTGSMAENVLPAVRPEYMEISAYIDERPSMRGARYGNSPVIDCDQIPDSAFDYILVACRPAETIRARLIALGVPAEKIVSLDVEALFHQRNAHDITLMYATLIAYLQGFPGLVPAIDVPTLLQSPWVRGMIAKGIYPLHRKYIQTLLQKPEFIGSDRYCNICGFRFSKFALFNQTYPREAQCPVCGSLERHRHLYIHLLSIYPFLKDKKVLHIAPGDIIKKLFQESPAEYIDADICERRARHAIDITDIQFEDEYFDYIICFHVFEHIENDIKAMEECHRVLKKGGMCFFCIPYTKEHKEYPNITDPAEREKIYGQSDHVRYYSMEVFLKRLQSVGFTVRGISDPTMFPEHLRQAKLAENIVLACKNG